MRIFISYRREQASAEARELEEILEDLFGEGSVYLDVKQPQLGDFRPHISREVAAADAMVVIITENWLGKKSDGSRRIDRPNDQVRCEVEAALTRDGVTVVPLLINGAEMPEIEELPAALADLGWNQWFPVRSDRLREDLAPAVELLQSADPDAPRLANQFAAVVAGGATKWLVPEPGTHLQAEPGPTRSPTTGSSIVLSADGYVAAQVMGSTATVFALVDPTRGTYERWLHAAIDESWRETRAVAVRRRGPNAVELALSYLTPSKQDRLVRLELRAGEQQGVYAEIGGRAVVGTFSGSALVFLESGTRRIRQWRAKESSLERWPRDLGLHARWLDGAFDGGELLVAVLGSPSTTSASDDYVVLMSESEESTYRVLPRSRQVVVPRVLDRVAVRRVLVRADDWIDVLGGPPAVDA